jgi:hypothetical protein
MTGNRCLHGVTTPVVNLPANPEVMTGEPPSPPSPSPP